MPLELEREILNRSLATKDTRHATQTMRWRGKREKSVNSGATIPEKCLHCQKQVFWLQLPEASICTSMFIYRNTFQVQHQQPFFSLGAHTGKHQQDPFAGAVLLWVDDGGQVGRKKATDRCSCY